MRRASALAAKLARQTFSLDPRRDVAIDALKGVAILFVILQHAVYEVIGDASPLRMVIRTFNMPLFAFASGLVLVRVATNPRFSDFVKRVRALLVPYVAWLVVAALVFLPHIPSEWLRLVTAGMLDARAEHTKWFLYALFLLSALFVFVRMITKHDWVLVAVGLVLVFLPPDLLPIRLHNGQVLFLFMVAGYLVAEHGWTGVPSKRLTAAWGVLWVAVCVAMWSWQARTGMLNRIESDYWFYTLVAIPGVVFWQYFCRLLRDMPRWNFAPTWIGTRTMGLYVAHGAFLGVYVGSAGLGIATSFVSSFALGLAVVLVLERVPLASQLLLGGPPVPLSGLRSTEPASST